MKLPSWTSAYRPHQVTSLSKILAEFNAGRSVVMLDAPTGSGKTLIGESVRRSLNARALYLCHSLQLQDQFVKDYPEAALLKGKSNYPIMRQPTAHGAVTAADCTKKRIGNSMICRWCDPISSCPYEEAKKIAYASDLVCTNISYFLHEANYVGGLPIKRDLIVIDEADTLEDEIMRFVEVYISKRKVAEYGIELPSKKTVLESWLDWAVVAHQRVTELAKQAQRDQSSVGAIRRAKDLDGLKRNLTRLLNPTYGLASGRWIYTDYDRGNICFKPVRIDHLTADVLWKYANRWLLMSASMISFQSMAADLGMTNYSGIAVRSSFPPESRPIHIKPVTKMSHKETNTAYPQMVAGLETILRRYPSERILVHTVSYKLAAYLTEHLPNDLRQRVCTYSSRAGKAQAITNYLTSRSSILIAASLDRGVDLPGDDCRVIVVCKTPFPNGRDKQINARLHSPGGQLWYNVRTVRSLVQMTGRGMRSADDHCKTYILDGQFSSMIWMKSRHLLPQWWKDALVWGDR